MPAQGGIFCGPETGEIGTLYFLSVRCLHSPRGQGVQESQNICDLSLSVPNDASAGRLPTWRKVL